MAATVFTRIAVTTAMIATAGVLVAAPLTPQVAIATRQANYKKMGAALKAINDQLKADAPARDVMIAAARTLAVTAREQPRLFPAGSGASAGVRTDALPGVWSDRAAFDAQMNKLIGETGKLVALTNGGDAAAIRGQVKATGAVCASCHRQFRADS